jgi:hypothetical protein
MRAYNEYETFARELVFEEPSVSLEELERELQSRFCGITLSRDRLGEILFSVRKEKSMQTGAVRDRGEAMPTPEDRFATSSPEQRRAALEEWAQKHPFAFNHEASAFLKSTFGVGIGTAAINEVMRTARETAKAAFMATITTAQVLPMLDIQQSLDSVPAKEDVMTVESPSDVKSIAQIVRLLREAGIRSLELHDDGTYTVKGAFLQ